MPKTYLEPDEVGQIEHAATNLRDRLLIRMLYRLACRVSEVLGIGEDDIDFIDGAVIIAHLKVRINLSCPKCGAKLSRTAKFCPGCGVAVEQAVSKATEHPHKRVIPIDSDTLALLRDYIARGGPVQVNGKRLIFGISRRRACEIVGECARKAGVGPLINPETREPRGISPHRLRDAFATMAVNKDGSPNSIRMLQEQLGHESIATTMKYKKVSDGELKEWYDRLMQPDTNKG